MPDPIFTSPPPAPARTAPATFSARMDAFLSWMVTFQSQLVSAVSWFSSTAATVAANSATARSAADDAVAAGGAILHNPATSYVIGDAAISNIDLLTYRASSNVPGPGSPDPSADLTKWKLVGFSRAYADLTGQPTLGTAAALDTGITAGKIPLLLTGGKLPAVDGSNLTNLIPRGVSPAVKTTIANGVSEVVVALPAGKGMLIIEGRGIAISGTGRIKIRMSNNGGSSYKAGGSDYSTLGSNASEIEAGANTETLHFFEARCLGANDSAVVFTMNGNIGGAVGVSGGSSFNVATDIRACSRFTGVTHLKFYIASGTFTGGEIFVSQVQQA